MWPFMKVIDFQRKPLQVWCGMVVKRHYLHTSNLDPFAFPVTARSHGLMSNFEGLEMRPKVFKAFLLADSPASPLR